jgi:hypothetical protein
MTAVDTHKSAHVLDHAQDGYVDLLEETHAAYCITQGEILWSGHDDSTCDN